MCPFWITTRPVGGYRFDYATDLADHAHVEHAGAQKISTDLAAYLAEHYGMPDKRGDAPTRRGTGGRMEHRDAQNITLRFTLDMARIFPPADAG